MDVTKIKVLVVEDVEIAQKMAVYILSKLNCQVSIAKNGHHALELIKENSYQLIFMDLGLPDMDGMIVTETIRQTSTANQQIPIIALTAHSNDEILVEECVKAGMNDFLTKPLTMQNAGLILNKYTEKNTTVAQANDCSISAATYQK